MDIFYQDISKKVTFLLNVMLKYKKYNLERNA